MVQTSVIQRLSKAKTLVGGVVLAALVVLQTIAGCMGLGGVRGTATECTCQGVGVTVEPLRPEPDPAFVAPRKAE